MVLLSLLVCGVASSEWEAQLLPLGFREFDQSVRATHSAKGATARPHIRAVCDSSTARALINRQVPSRCSKNQARFSGSRVIHSSKKASTCGRTGSIRSHVRLSRAGVCACQKPSPGSSPRVATAIRVADSSTGRQVIQDRVSGVGGESRRASWVTEKRRPPPQDSTCTCPRCKVANTRCARRERAVRVGHSGGQACPTSTAGARDAGRHVARRVEQPIRISFDFVTQKLSFKDS
jgi:hypothetical protein